MWAGDTTDRPPEKLHAIIDTTPVWKPVVEALAHLRPGGRLVVLDFSRFHGWGPLAPVMRTWLRLNHVETLRPYEDRLRAALPDTQVHYWLGGYNFTAVGRRAS